MNIALYIIGGILVLYVVRAVQSYVHKRNYALYAVAENCTACGKCLKICRHKVLEMVKDGKNSHIILKNPNKCEVCEKCLKVCKFDALKIVKRTHNQNDGIKNYE